MLVGYLIGRWWFFEPGLTGHPEIIAIVLGVFGWRLLKR
jgi:hypothetical protein